jgi:hypothetical protein
MIAATIGQDRYLLFYGHPWKTDRLQLIAKPFPASTPWKWIDRSGTGWVAKSELSLDW